jgi:uncharacterized RDD family membrane protein YckC
MNNPYSPPKAAVSDFEQPEPGHVEYAGFWVRVGASIIDSILMVLIAGPLLWYIYGADYFLVDTGRFVAGTADVLISYVFPAVAIIAFWLAREATPGKMALSLAIVDADTFGKIRVGQAIGRYFGYYLSSLPLGLGLFWVGWDERKQGWHDKLAGTVVVYKRRRGATGSRT